VGRLSIEGELGSMGHIERDIIENICGTIEPRRKGGGKRGRRSNTPRRLEYYDGGREEYSGWLSTTLGELFAVWELGSYVGVLMSEKLVHSSRISELFPLAGKNRGCVVSGYAKLPLHSCGRRTVRSKNVSVRSGRKIKDFLGNCDGPAALPGLRPHDLRIVIHEPDSGEKKGSKGN